MLIDILHLFDTRCILRPWEMRECQSDNINGTWGPTTYMISDILVTYLFFLLLSSLHVSFQGVTMFCLKASTSAPQNLKNHTILNTERDYLISKWQKHRPKEALRGEELFLSSSFLPRSHFIVPSAHTSGAFASTPYQENTPSVRFMNWYIVFSTIKCPSIETTPCGLKFGNQMIPLVAFFTGPLIGIMGLVNVNLLMKGNLNP